MAHVIVVGAGVGGLACAARLAASGHRVTVFEQAEVVGGKLGRYERRTPAGTFRFDTGPSLVTLPQVFDDLFAATGSTLAQELDLVRLDPLVRHVFADRTTLDSTSDPAEFRRRIAAAFGEAAARDWHRLWRRAERVWQTSWRHVLRRRVDSPLSLATLAWRVGDLAAIAPGQTLRGLGRRHLADAHLRTMLDRYATYTGSDPRLAPAALVAIPYAELAFGGWYLRGGLATLADALARRCDELGVKIHTGARVTRILTSGGEVTGVRLVDAAAGNEADAPALAGAAVRADAGVSVEADVVVANVDAASVYRELLPTPARSRALAQRSLAGFVMLLGVRGRTPSLAHHTVYFPADYDAEFDAIFARPARPVPDPTVFVTVADDPAARPDQHEAWFVLINAAPHGHDATSVDWRVPGLADEYAHRVLAILAERGVDVRDRLLFQEVRTPADLADATRSPGGAIYGTPSHGLTGLLRPPNRGPVRGLFLVGGSTHPGGGLPMVTLSAQIVAEQIGPG
ncbi:MAG TPA: phytoene desaturase family protein [Micromonosporaceae bacterium]